MDVVQESGYDDSYVAEVEVRFWVMTSNLLLFGVFFLLSFSPLFLTETFCFNNTESCSREDPRLFLEGSSDKHEQAELSGILKTLFFFI